MIAKIDGFLYVRVFMRLAHWIDWRFHWNNYRVAALFFRIGAVASIGVLATALITINSWPLKCLFVLIQPLVAWSFLHSSEKLNKAAKEWERGGKYLPQEAIKYVLAHPASRVCEIMWALPMLGTPLGDSLRFPIWFVIPEAFFWIWPFYIGCALYFAAIPPSTKTRKKQEEKAPIFGQLATIGSR